MLRKLFTVLSIIACTSGALIQAQNESAVKVKLTDKANHETIPFANVVVESGGIQVGVGTTNIDGEVMIKPLNPGKYNVKATYVGYQTVQIENVILSVGKTAYLNMEMTAGQQLKEVEVVEYSVPLIDPSTVSGATVTREDYQNMASKNINSVAATTAGIYQADEGAGLNVRGARSEGTAYYVDGQKVIGSAGVPQSMVEQITTIVGGTPAEYGDATGGIISITTRGPASKYSAGVEVITSGAGEKKGLDAYGYNFVGFSINGPILLKKDSVSNVKKSVLGFSIGGEASHVNDGDPSAIGMYRINKDKLADLEQHPIRPSPQGNGFVLNSEYVTANDLEKIKAKQNAASNVVNLSGKIQYQPTTNLGITVGGSVNYNKYHSFVYQYALFNPVNNPQVIDDTWRIFAKLTQKFNSASTKEEEKSSSVIKNAYFTLQPSYEKRNYTREDDSHKDNFFDYGYIGKFHQSIANTYILESRDKYDVNGDGKKDTVTALFHNGFDFTDLSFVPSDKNPTGTNYTQQYYNYAGTASNGSEVQQGFGLLNGDNATNIYSIWRNTGRQYPSYEKFNNSQFRVVANFSADIKNHAIQIGFEYEQRTERDFSLSPVGLWTRMRQLANAHIQNLDSIPVYNATLSTLSGIPAYDFNRRNDGTQKQFDRSLREKLGKDPNGTEWIDVDSYDPSMFTLNMFSADDLLVNGGSSQYVNYYGYDYTGKKLSGKPSLDDFFTKKDVNGNYTRQVGAYQPIYIAGYIQDKFDFRNLKFNVGLRVDRFDANQKVLKDKYLLYEAKTANEVNYSQLGAIRPSNIGDDYVVYVDNKDAPTKIVGYRSKDTWYNAQGTETTSPATELSGSNTVDGRINPYLIDPSAAKKQLISPKVFTDYTPQINFMPRIAFAFPISDVANFFAHYDVLTQRPPGSNRMDPIQYLNIQNYNAFLDNPDLKPVKTTDYELGFTQVLNERKNSALTLSAFYREMRNMIQTTVVNQAFPTNYSTYTNIDFGTVKGFSVAYDLRRTKGIRLTASYTLQFADGTGSNAADGQNLVNAGLPNLRVPHPLDNDQRHRIVLNADYRFGNGKDYSGPVWTRKKGDTEKTIRLLEDVGANIVLSAGSGTPYSRQNNITEDVGIGIAQQSFLKGDVNGSNLPWSYRMDLKVDKNLALTWGGKKEGEEKKHANLNIYLQVLNVLNTKNIIAVYRYTGNPNDDGYLTGSNGQRALANANSATSLTDLYTIAVNNPNNYSRPRVIRLGLLLDF